MVSVVLLILLLQSNLTTTATPGDKAQGHPTTVFCKISVWRIFCCLNTVNNLINARDVYLILGVQEGRLIDGRHLKERGVYSSVILWLDLPLTATEPFSSPII